MKLLLLLALGLAITVTATNRRYRVNAVNDFTQNDEDAVLEEDDDDDDNDVVLSRSNFVLEDAKKLKIKPEAERLTGQALVDYVNRRQDLWTARLSPKFENFNDEVKWGMLGVNHVANSVKAKKHLSKTRLMDVQIPTQFDSRTQWAQCKGIGNIRDQSSCGSCWAFGAVEAMSDRICIASNGKVQVALSAVDLLSCCRSCGFGCNGGDPMAAWKYWVHDGIVTGSNYTQHEGCKPYPFSPCEHHSNKTHFKPCQHDLFPTPKCEKKCQDSYDDKPYNKDKYFGRVAYAISDDVEAIQKELMTHGPLEIAFEVYEDFLNYAGGIYIHQGGKLGGGHAVKLVGWGEEGGVPYWIVANSWNTDWGEDGFFRIVRGKDECGIESGVVGGIPELNKTQRQRLDID